MSTLDGREPVVPASGSEVQAPEPTPSNGEVVFWKNYGKGSRTLWLCVGDSYVTAAPTEFCIRLGRLAPRYIVLHQNWESRFSDLGRAKQHCLMCYRRHSELAGSTADAPALSNSEQKGGN